MKSPRPYKITRKLQLNDTLITIVPIATSMDGNNVETLYAQAERATKSSGKENFHTQKSKRILEALQAAIEPVPAPELSRIGSGKPDGWCASFSKEISRLRALGHNVVKMLDKRVNGQRQTTYQLNPPSIE